MSSLRTLPPARALLAVLLAVVLAGVLGCGADEELTSGEEGEYINAGDAVYQVQLTRLLNPNQRPDDEFLRGQSEPRAGQQYLAVFLTIENEGRRPYKPPREMGVVDTQGIEYPPLEATKSGFELLFGDPIPPGGKAPPPDSPAASGPNAGALVLFRISEQSATENLPLELEIPNGTKEPSRVELDV